MRGLEKYISVCEQVGGTSKGKQDFERFLSPSEFREGATLSAGDTYCGAQAASAPLSQVSSPLHPELSALQESLVPLLCCHNGTEQAHQIKNFWAHSPEWFPVQYSPEGGLQVVIHPFH